MTYQDDIGNFMGNLLGDFNFFGVEWIIPLVIVFLSVIMISRDKEEWKVLAFPVMVGWTIVGLRSAYVFLLIAGIMYVMEIISIRTIGNYADIVVDRFRKVKRRSPDDDREIFKIAKIKDKAKLRSEKLKIMEEDIRRSRGK